MVCKFFSLTNSPTIAKRDLGDVTAISKDTRTGQRLESHDYIHTYQQGSSPRRHRIACRLAYHLIPALQQRTAIQRSRAGLAE